MRSSEFWWLCCCLPCNKLAKPPGDGKWSIKQVLAHLADGEFVIGTRLRYVAAMDRPAIVGGSERAQ